MTTIVLNGTSCTNLRNGSYSDFQFIYTYATGTFYIDKNLNRHLRHPREFTLT
jgi:hypothetical protein